VIEYNQMAGASKERCHCVCRPTAMQIILKNEQRGCGYSLALAKDFSERTRLHQRKTKAVTFQRGETQSRRMTYLAQRPGNLRRSFDHALAATAGTRNH